MNEEQKEKAILEDEVDCCMEDEGYEDEDNCVICRRCKEWTSVVKCSQCHDILFESSCCP